MESNVQKMREALEVVRDALTTISAHENDKEFVRTWIELAKQEVYKALALPLRQCDVGTAEEQAERFISYCAHEECKRDRCQLFAKACFIDSCALAWAQMPYKAQEGGDHVAD